MQSQMIGMQSTLDRILTAVQHGPPPGFREPTNGPPMRGPDIYNPAPNPDQRVGRTFPPLPGFAPPVRYSRISATLPLKRCPQPHKYATYGIVPSTAPSSDDESEDALPRSSLNAPIEALQGLANAAAEAAAAPSDSLPR